MSNRSDVRAALEARLRASLEVVAAAEADFDRLVEASRSVSTDDEHDPDGAGLAVERALVVALATSGRVQVAELEGALRRLELGTYGRCLTCGRAIGAGRLEARPEALTCIDCAGTARR